jgi:hypothetical protein
MGNLLQDTGLETNMKHFSADAIGIAAVAAAVARRDPLLPLQRSKAVTPLGLAGWPGRALAEGLHALLELARFHPVLQ